DAVRPERGADRRRGRRSPGGDLDLDDRGNLLLGHDVSLLTQETCADGRRAANDSARDGGRATTRPWAPVNARPARRCPARPATSLAHREPGQPARLLTRSPPLSGRRSPTARRARRTR